MPGLAWRTMKPPSSASAEEEIGPDDLSGPVIVQFGVVTNTSSGSGTNSIPPRPSNKSSVGLSFGDQVMAHIASRPMIARAIARAYC